MVDKYPGWNPYNYCANNTLMVIDPNGIDWYINRENGALLWFNGKYDDASIPEGYTWFSKDDYFGNNAMYQELKNHNTNSISVTPEQSEKFAESFDFALRPLVSFSRTVTNYYSGGGGEYSGNSKSGEMVWSKLTYVYKWAEPTEDSYVLQKKGDLGCLTLTEMTIYKYGKRSYWIPFWNFFGKIVSAVGHSFENNRVSIYTWSNYSKNGALNTYKNAK